MKQRIKYEPHPVTPERKAELRAAGFVIIDARFRPADDPQPAQPTQNLTRTQVARMAKGDLADELLARGLDAAGSADVMRERLANAVFG